MSRGVGYRLKFWEGGENMVFPKVNCPRDHAEGGRRVRGHSGIVPSTGTSDDARYCRLGGRYGGASVTVGGAFKRG